MIFEPDELHLIAEVGVNHEGDFDRAKKIIESAARAGASSVKLQHYEADTLASPRAKAYWDTNSEKETSQRNLFSKGFGFSTSQISALRRFANDECGVAFGLSVFDHNKVRELAPYLDYFKVASGDITYKQLITEVARSGLPTVISTGASQLIEVVEATSWIEDAGGNPPVILQCTLAYPTPVSMANLSSIGTLVNEFPSSIVGVSDHIADSDPIRFGLAWTMGARVFEKHYSDLPGASGNDHYHSFGEDSLANVVRYLQDVMALCGEGELLLDAERPARLGARRSLHLRSNLSAGHVLTPEDILIVRPGDGMPPKELERVVGRTLVKDVQAGNLLTNEDFSK